MTFIEKRLGLVIICLAVVTGVLVFETRAVGLPPFDSQRLVIDSSGQTIGTFLSYDFGSQTLVGVPLNGEWITMRIFDRSQFLETSLWFTSINCTGQAFMPRASSAFLATSVSVFDGTVYVERGPEQMVTVQASLEQYGCQPFDPFSDSLVPISPTRINVRAFTPPFRVVAR